MPSQGRLVGEIYAVDGLAQYQGKVDEAVEVMGEQVRKRGGEPAFLEVWLQLFAFDARLTRTEVALVSANGRQMLPVD